MLIVTLSHSVLTTALRYSSNCSVAQSCPALCGPMDCGARQASLSFTISQSLLKLLSIELVMPSSHLILCRPLLLPPSVFSSIRAFSNESALDIRWPKYWSFSFNISPSNEYFSRYCCCLFYSWTVCFRSGVESNGIGLETL